MAGTAFPTQDGYHWLTLSGGGDWQVVHVLTTKSSQHTRRYVFFAGTSERETQEQFDREYPQATWGPRVTAPNEEDEGKPTTETP